MLFTIFFSRKSIFACSVYIFNMLKIWRSRLHYHGDGWYLFLYFISFLINSFFEIFNIVYQIFENRYKILNVDNFKSTCMAN